MSKLSRKHPAAKRAIRQLVSRWLCAAGMSLIAIGNLSAGLQAAEQVLWQIGQADGHYAEFAIAGNYPAYKKRFGDNAPVFTVGSSRPERDWPFIHPGPVDAWAGSRVHPFRIRFVLDQPPQGTFYLRIYLCDTQGRVPPQYQVSIAGRTGRVALPRGGGDQSLTDPAAGKPRKIEMTLPAALFHQGENEITLTCVDGSWVLYDCLLLANDRSLAQPPPGIARIRLESTPFFVRRSGQLHRVLNVQVGFTSPPKTLALTIRAGDHQEQITVDEVPLLGDLQQEVVVPDLPPGTEVVATASVDSQTEQATLALPEQRKWRIFVAPSAHTDIGYTDIQPKCAERHSDNIDLAMKLIGQYPHFKWNCEVAWQLEHFLRTRSPEQKERFVELTQEGRLGVQALYCNILTGLCSHEEICRLTLSAHNLHRELGIPYRSAMINDVPTLVSTMPMVLTGSGIGYFSEGSNNTRAPTFTKLYERSPCWWEGPDGSRVLMVYVPSYLYAHRLGLDASIDVARRRIAEHIAGYEAREDYPVDAIFANGAVSDNQPLNPKLAEVVEEWNRRYEFPKVILCHNAEFFDYVKERFGDQLPVVRGSAGTYWEDGAGSSARETALCRNAHEWTENAERLFVLAQLHGREHVELPADRLRQAWRNCLLYDEHTWGAHCSISQPESEFTKAQWKIKAQFAHRAAKLSRSLLRESAEQLARLIGTDGPGVLVFNPLSWTTGGIVSLKLPEGQSPTIADVICCRVGDRLLAWVPVVPACGYRLLPTGPVDRVPAATEREGTVIESRYWRVEFDPNTGAISSLLDKELDRQLVDPAAPYKLNQYLYVAGGKGTSIEHAGRPPAELAISTPTQATLKIIDLGPLGQRMVVTTSATQTPRIISEVTVWNTTKRIDFVDRLEKQLTYEKEAAYFAFPFAADRPVFRYQEPCAVVRPDTDFLPGACLDWFTVQHFVEVTDRQGSVTWSTPDAPLVCFQDINRGKWQTELPLNNGHLYAYVMNNYWFTNYLAGQGGEFCFRFAITSRKQFDPVASARFGWEVSSGLVTVPIPARNNGPLPAQAASLVEIEPKHVLLVGLKQAEDGNGSVVRLWNLADEETTAHVRFPLATIQTAQLSNLVEEPQQQLPVRESTIEVPIRARGLATVRVK